MARTLQYSEPVKVLHCTYPYRPQYAKKCNQNLLTRILDRLAQSAVAKSPKNPWRPR
jgi:hypothetical protein